MDERGKAARKGLGKTVALLIIFAVVLTLAFAVYLVGAFKMAGARDGSYRFVGFSAAGDADFAYTTDAASLMDTPLSLDTYNSRIYYDKLSETDKQIYRAFETALENGWEEVYLDGALVESCRHTPSEILILLALDSPFLEQNIQATEGRHFSRYVSGDGISMFGSMMSGVRIDVKNFAPERLEKKKAALAKAQEIAAVLGGETDRDKASAVFFYLLERLSYQGEKAFDDSDYLYDALCLEESNCDGFTNGFSLLAKLLGLDVFEKNYQPADGSIGHTWNCVRLDGVWYNVDVTFAQGYIAHDGKEIREDSDEILLTRYATFGFPDARQRHPHDFEDLAPPCETELMEPDLVLESDLDLPWGEVIAAALKEKSVILVVTNFHLEGAILQDAANRVGAIHSASLEPLGNDIYYAIRKK